MAAKLIVTNGVDMSRFKPMPKDSDLVAQLGLQGKFVGGYVEFSWHGSPS